MANGQTTQGFSSSVQFTRPNDTNAYTAGDVIGTATGSTAAHEFKNVGKDFECVMITDVDLMVNVTSIPSGMTSFRLHLYSATPGSAYGDNAAWDLPSGDRASYLGYVDLGNIVDVGSTLYVQASFINKVVKMGSTTSLYGYLVTNGGFTPTAQAVKKIRINTVAM